MKYMNRLSKTRSAAFVVALVFVTFGCTKAHDKPTETLICRIPDNLVGDVFVSDDSKHWCCVVKTASGQTVVGDRQYAPGDYTVIANMQWSSISGRCGFWGQTQNHKVVVVVDSREFPTDSESEGSLDWSADGKRWMAAWGNCAGGQRGDCVVLVDGMEVGRYSDISWPCFSQISAHYGYFFKENGALCIAIDGKKAMGAGANTWASMMTAVCGPNIHAFLSVLNDGSVAYVAPMPSESKSKDGDLWTVGKGNKQFASYQTAVIRVGNRRMQLGGDAESQSLIVPESLSISKDGSTVAWWAQPGKKGSEWSVLLNGQRIYGSADANPNSDYIKLSSDGKRVGFRVWIKGEGTNQSVAASIDGKLGVNYNWLGGIQFSEDCKRYSYWAVRLGSTTEKPYIYVVDGQEVGAPFDSTTDFAFSPNSKHWTFTCERDKKEFLVTDGIEVLVPYKRIWALKIDNDGTPQFFADTETSVLSVVGIPDKAKP
jgi:hypothetical protein